MSALFGHATFARITLGRSTALAWSTRLGGDACSLRPDQAPTIWLSEASPLSTTLGWANASEFFFHHA